MLPHFLQCDLVMVSAKSFQGGQGLQVQIRTTLESAYSFIEEVAIKIGEETLQVAGDGMVFFNDRDIGDDLTTDLPMEVSGFPLTFHKDELAAHFYNITFGQNGDSASKRGEKWSGLILMEQLQSTLETPWGCLETLPRAR